MTGIRIVLLSLLLGLLGSVAHAETVQVPEITAFLPKIVDVKPGAPTPIDGMWSISSLDKVIRIDRGRAYAIEGWNHMLVLKIKPGMVVIRDIKQEDTGVYAGKDLPLAGDWLAVLTGDRILDCRVGKVRYQLIPQQLDDPEAFNALFRQVREVEAQQGMDAED